MSDTISELYSVIFSVDKIQEKIDLFESSLLNLSNEIKLQEDTLSNIEVSKQYYKKAIDLIYERSVLQLKDVLNSALSFVFSAKDLNVDIEINDKRGKSLSFVITHNGKRVNLKRGMGMGIKCVISCILHIYYLQCKNSKVLILDEAYYNLSKEYIASFFEFLDKLTKQLGFKIILVTHDERFINYCDKLYNIKNGKVTLVKDVKTIIGDKIFAC